MAQESLYKQFTQLHYPVKFWVITHPFKAKRAMQISNETRNVTELIMNDSDLDGDYAGGQVDAFRHLYWMFGLAEQIGVRAARKLGKAYEHSNRIDFKKKLLEDDFLPDFMTSEMDLRNNEIGLSLFRQHQFAAKKNRIDICKKKILDGKAFVVKKNKNGQFLNSENHIIKTEDYLGRWFTPKTLVSSNFVRP